MKIEHIALYVNDLEVLSAPAPPEMAITKAVSLRWKEIRLK